MMAGGAPPLSYAQDGGASGEWPYFGADKAFTRYSSLAQIDRDNVGRQEAHRVDVGRFGRQQIRCRATEIDGVVHARSPRAVDPLVGPPLVKDRHRLRPRVRVRALRDEHLDERETSELGRIFTSERDDDIAEMPLRRT